MHVCRFRPKVHTSGTKWPRMTSDGQGMKSRGRVEPVVLLPLWQRVLITVAGMLIASYVAGLLWEAAFAVPVPSYVSGIIGGLAALPIWELLKRFRPRR